MAVRAALPEDWERIRDVRLAALRDAPDAFSSTLEGSEGQPQWRWEGWATGEGWGATVATFVEEPRPGAGFTALATAAAFKDDPRVVHLFAMWVAPEARRSGIGRELVERVVSWAAESGAAEVFLRVTEGNDVAARLYRACGFVLDAEDREPLREGSALEILGMRRTL
jgi:GNAT superfamily N-acetyltransferase